MMGGIDIDADYATIRSGMELGADGAKTLGQNDIGTTMEQANWLGIAFNGHPTNQSSGGGFEYFNAHLLIERATSAFLDDGQIVDFCTHVQSLNLKSQHFEYPRLESHT